MRLLIEVIFRNDIYIIGNRDPNSYVSTERRFSFGSNGRWLQYENEKKALHDFVTIKTKITRVKATGISHHLLRLPFTDVIIDDTKN